MEAFPTETNPFFTIPVYTYPATRPQTQPPTAAPQVTAQSQPSASSTPKESGLTFSAVLAGLLIGGSAVILILKKRCS